MELEEFRLEEDVLETLKQSGLTWFATGRFGLDMLLGRPLDQVDVYSVYVPEPELERWEEYIVNKGGARTDLLPNLRIIPTSSYDLLLESIDDYSGLNSEKEASHTLRDILLYERKHRGKPRMHYSYEDFKRKLEQKESSRDGEIPFSLGNSVPHVISYSKLRSDLMSFAPRYKDNIISEFLEGERRSEQLSFPFDYE